MNLVIYEHPLNEKQRTFMRVEHLFGQLMSCKALQFDHQFQVFFDALFAMMDMLDRSDLRSDLVKELERNEQNLVKWAQHPQICNEVLQDTLRKVVNLQNTMSKKSKMCNSLKDDPFLESIRKRFTMPGPSCDFDLPQLHYWRQLPEQLKQTHVKGWLEQLSMTQEAITLIQTFVRERSGFVSTKAPGGFYQDNAENLDMLRIKYTPAYGAYPTVSGNKYRYAIRFMRLCDEQGRTTVDEDVIFSLARC